MSLAAVRIGKETFSKLIIGGNPFSGFSHQSPAKDDQMRHHYTTARIRETLLAAERLGITAHISRADHHVMRYLMEHWDQGGKMQWIAQTCPEVGSIERAISNAIGGHAKACYIHGGVMDNLVATGQTAELPEAIARIRAAGMPAGIAGHKPEVFDWARKNLDVDFYMCSYYNPTSRDKNPEHVPGQKEWFHNDDRQRMADLIQTLERPVIHYKVMAAGRNKPEEALAFVAKYLRPQDAVCIGVFTGDASNAMAENLKLLEQFLGRPA